MPTDEFGQLLQKLRGAPWTRRLLRSDPRYGDLVRRVSSTARSLAEAIEELSQLADSAPERVHLAEALRMAFELEGAMTTTTIEDELGGLLDAAKINGSNREIVARRLGWDGGGGMTLEAAADGKLTRERVRQLEERVRKSSARVGWLPTVATALELVHANAPISCEQAGELLAANGLALQPFDPVGLLNAARFAGMDESLRFAGGCLYAGEQREQAARVAEAARKLVTHNGAASVSAVGDSVGGLSADEVRRFLALDPDTHWLDSDRDWLFLPTGRNRAANHLRKMLAVASSLTVREVRDGFRRYDGREVKLPRAVVWELCKCFDWVRVDGDRISSAVELDYREVLENTEETLVDIFREHGPVLDRATAVDLGERNGLDRTTSGLYLGWSPVIERVAINRYALRGSDIPAGTLEAMRGTSPRTRVQRGYGWTNDGRLWVGYMLSQAVIDSHVVGVPSSLKSELQGRFVLAAPDDHLGELATDGANLWGLSRLLKRYGAEAGDALVLEFDLNARRVHAFVGGAELLDPDSRPDRVVEETNAEADADAVGPADESAPGGGNCLIGTQDDFTSLQPPRPQLFDTQLDLTSPTAMSAVATVDEPVEETLLEVLEPTRAVELGQAIDVEAEIDISASHEPEPAVDPCDDRDAGPELERCVVPGCEQPGKHKLGVRCRVWHEPSPVAGKSKTSALWAPDADAFLCDEHALGGAHITLIYEPNDSGETALKVIAAPHADERRTPIRGRRDSDDGLP
jgi:hypothetical protein